jgi:pyruvate/2-oxoglutarate dehydrogenase complex dihydrolipoamide dehydrogenase (E3) component
MIRTATREAGVSGEHYDLAMIGEGVGGAVAANKGASLEAKVAIIEKGEPGAPESTWGVSL